MDFDLELLFESTSVACRACKVEFDVGSATDPLENELKTLSPSCCPNCGWFVRTHLRPARNAAMDLLLRMYGIPSGQFHVPNVVVELWTLVDERHDLEVWRNLLLQADMIEQLGDKLLSAPDEWLLQFTDEHHTDEWIRWRREYINQRANAMLEDLRTGRYTTRINNLFSGLGDLIRAEQARHLALTTTPDS